MTPDRTVDVERICEAALEREPSARAAFLAEACAGDDVLQGQVERLLARESAAEGFLRTPAIALAWDTQAEGAMRIGHRLGPYEILARIGGGGMGDVYKARDTHLPRTVAVKVPKAPYSERFRREANTIAQLNHPHICTLYDAGQDYLVIEYVEGTPLKGPLPADRAMAYARQSRCARGRASAARHPSGSEARQHPGHEAGRQASRLRPGAHQREDEPALTRTGDVMGTPAYMAPEQREGKRSDSRTDIYAFGCVLYEMLTGKRVTTARTPVQPSALERIITQCLAQNPDDRFQSAHDVKLALDLTSELHAAVVPARRRRAPLVAAAAAVRLAALLGGWAASRIRRPEMAEPVLRLQLAPAEGSQFGRLGQTGIHLALSPDGKMAVYAATLNNRRSLWLRSLDGTTASPLHGTETGEMPFWSPDGRFLAFFAGGRLQRLDVAGGTIFDICITPRAFGGAWSSDGRILVGLTGGTIAVVAASGGTLMPLTHFDAAMGDVAHVWPQVLPGGHFLYWSASKVAGNNGVIYAASFEKPDERVKLVTSDTGAVYASNGDRQGYLLWQRNGALVAQAFDGTTLTLSGDPRPIADAVGTVGSLAYLGVAVSANGTLIHAAPDLQQLTWFERSGKPLGTLGDPGQFWSFLRFSPDGKQVATTRIETGRELWVLDVEHGTSRRTTFDSGGGFTPIWSPDGRTILFVGDNITALYRKDVKGGGPDQRLSGGTVADIFLTDWSRDGRFALNNRVTLETRQDIWVVRVTPDGRLDAAEQPRPYPRTPVNEYAGRFSPEPNPRWVAYQSDENGRNEIYVQSFPEPRGPHRISVNGGRLPQWGPGGRELFYASLDNKVMVARLELGSDTVGVSTPQELFAIPAESFFEVAPDGQRFLVNLPDPRPPPLTVIVNWPALMKQPPPGQ